MAMQFGRSIRRSIRVNNFPALSKSKPFVAANSSIRALSSSSMHPSPKPVSWTGFRMVLQASGLPLLGTWLYWWNFGGFRKSYEEWRCKTKAQAILKKIDRNKCESKEAYLNMLARMKTKKSSF